MYRDGRSRAPDDDEQSRRHALPVLPPGYPDFQINSSSTSANAAYQQQPSLLGPFTMSNARPQPMAHHSSPYGIPASHSAYHQPLYTPPYLHQPTPVEANSHSLPSPVTYTPQGTTSPPPHLSAGSPSAHSTNYSDTGSYHPAISYSLPVSPPAFSFPHQQQSYPASPQYPSGQYNRHLNYPQHFPDTEGQGTWWYLPPTRQYDAAPARYQGPFAVDYSHRSPENAQHSAPSSTHYSGAPHHVQLPPPRLPQTTSSSVAPMSSVSPNADSAPYTPPSRETPPEKPLMRRAYHPNPPTHRSEWVMWVGNVPSDATHDEVWRFFSSPVHDQSTSDSATTGVLSIFLIARSSCAFVNFESEAALLRAIAMFNGVSLRPNDLRCAMLVCRVRRKDDDLKAGVGGQRGTGMHTRWVQQQKAKAKELDASGAPISMSPPVSIPESYFEESPLPDSSSSGSFSSTNSSMLGRYFPKRYFILKSLTQEDLENSVRTGYWTTQRHNEDILDQAYRSSKEGVFLIFGVNKSGEFFGYGRMAGPINDEPPDPDPPTASTIANAAEDTTYFPHHFVEESPAPLRTPEEMRTAIIQGAARYKPNLKSAPAELGPPHQVLTPVTPEIKLSLDTRKFKPERPVPNSQQPTVDAFHSPNDPAFTLDEDAPMRAVRDPQMINDLLGAQEDDSELGKPFRVDWVCTDRLPFYLTRHLRNEWNKEREVKVSRDGTEIEPTVGERLLNEWRSLAADAEGKTHGKRKAKAGPMR